MLTTCPCRICESRVVLFFDLSKSPRLLPPDSITALTSFPECALLYSYNSGTRRSKLTLFEFVFACSLVKKRSMLCYILDL